MLDFEKILDPYNPWWSIEKKTGLESLPSFRRPVFSTLIEDLKSIL